MTKPPEPIRPPKFLENSLLVVAGLIAHAPLYYQVPRWADGLDPTFVHSQWLEQSPVPFLLHMASLHPLLWLVITLAILVRICFNYGWGKHEAP